MDMSRFGALSDTERDAAYPTSQQIAEACFFLGADGILVPGARHGSPNLIIFCGQDPPPNMDVLKGHGLIEWEVAANSLASIGSTSQETL